MRLAFAADLAEASVPVGAQENGAGGRGMAEAERLVLVADVGGTNTRFALGRAGVLLSDTLVRFQNDDHPTFDHALTTYLARQDLPALAAMCIAVAGPVWGDTARLTNRDWQFAAAPLAAVAGAGRVRLINDLTALGHAVATLGAAGVTAVAVPTEPGGVRNGQALVLGLGTGVNACAVKALGGHALCLEAEAGHARLPAPIAMELTRRIGTQADLFPTVEELFAGRGLARLHAALTGGAEVAGDVLARAAAGGDAAAAATLHLFSGLLGTYCRDLALLFMPRDGIYLAGSVARGVVGADTAGAFTAAFTADAPFAEIPRSIRVALIDDDMAALTGCLRALEG